MAGRLSRGRAQWGRWRMAAGTIRCYVGSEQTEAQRGGVVEDV